MTVQQQLFESAVEIDREILDCFMRSIRATARERADVLARIAVASDHVASLFTTILQISKADELPFRERFESLEEVCRIRARSLQELILRGDVSNDAWEITLGVISGPHAAIDTLMLSLQDSDQQGDAI